MPSVAVTVRRLHDTDRSGWWVLILIVPVVVLGAAIASGTVSSADELDAMPLILLVGGVKPRRRFNHAAGVHAAARHGRA